MTKWEDLIGGLSMEGASDEFGSRDRSNSESGSTGISGDTYGNREPYEYTLDAESGPVDVVVYFECREIPAEGAVLAMRYVTPIDVYEDELYEWQVLLESVEVSGQ